MNIMNTPELRNELHKKIDLLDDSSLKKALNVIQEFILNQEDHTLTEAQKQIIDQRLSEYKKNPQNVLSWEESRQLLKKIL